MHPAVAPSEGFLQEGYSSCFPHTSDSTGRHSSSHTITFQGVNETSQILIFPSTADEDVVVHDRVLFVWKRSCNDPFNALTPELE